MSFGLLMIYILLILMPISAVIGIILGLMKIVEKIKEE